MTFKLHRLGVISFLFIVSILTLGITPTESAPLQIPVKVYVPVGQEQYLNSLITDNYLLFYLLNPIMDPGTL